MNERPINCNIKNPVCLIIPEDKHFSQTFHSGCKIIDISFPSVINPEVRYYFKAIKINASLFSSVWDSMLI